MLGLGKQHYKHRPGLQSVMRYCNFCYDLVLSVLWHVMAPLLGSLLSTGLQTNSSAARDTPGPVCFMHISQSSRRPWDRHSHLQYIPFPFTAQHSCRTCWLIRTLNHWIHRFLPFICWLVWIWFVVNQFVFKFMHVLFFVADKNWAVLTGSKANFQPMQWHTKSVIKCKATRQEYTQFKIHRRALQCCLERTGRSGRTEVQLTEKQQTEHWGALKDRAKPRARISGGINTWNHIGLCSDLKPSTNRRRAVCYKWLRLKSGFIFTFLSQLVYSSKPCRCCPPE